MGDDLDFLIAKAEARGQQGLRDEPRARSARYDAASGRICIEMTKGTSFAFPARLAQGLERASDEQLAEVEVLGLGLGLHWEALDEDISIEGLLQGLPSGESAASLKRWLAARRSANQRVPPTKARRRASAARGGSARLRG